MVENLEEMTCSNFDNINFLKLWLLFGLMQLYSHISN